MPWRTCALALLVALAPATPSRAGSVLDAPVRRNVGGGPASQIEALDYRILEKSALPGKKKVSADPSLRQQMDALDLQKSREDFRQIKEPPPAPKLDYSQWVPSWMGTTGGLDLPWAYSLPRGKWVVGLIAKDRDADSRFWPQVYRNISGSDRGLAVNYGLRDGLELTVDLDRQDRTFLYAPQPALNNPAAAPSSARFQGDPVLAGGGLKGTVKFDDVQLAVGFHASSFRNLDRNVIEFHDYDRLNNLYAVVSTREGKQLSGHLSARYVTYDWGGSIFPSGATAASAATAGSGDDSIFVDPAGIARRGFGPGHSQNGYPVFQIVDPSRPDNGAIVQDPPAGVNVVRVGKGSSDWYNLGFGLDFEPSRNLKLMGEVVWETGINFFGAEAWFVNTGARYSRANWAATLGMRHVSSRGYREPVLSVAYRF